jgi:hypothetical protein
MGGAVIAAILLDLAVGLRPGWIAVWRLVFLWWSVLRYMQVDGLAGTSSFVIRTGPDGKVRVKKAIAFL